MIAVGCQSPSRRGTHFYGEKGITPFVVPSECQSPSRRGTHFYPYQCLGWCPWSVECQSPSRRGTHFYGSDPPRPYSRCIVSIPFTSGNSFLRCLRIFQLKRFSTCVNPLHVGELISTYLIQEPMVIFFLVSIPFTSGNSFLHTRAQFKSQYKEWCQSPSRRGTHFYCPNPFVRFKLTDVSIPFTSGNSFLQG